MQPRLAVERVEVIYTAPGGDTALPALGPLSFSIEAGSFICLIGPSGCGKSTLIRILAGLQRPTTGSATLDGQPISVPSRRVGLMFQDANLMPWRTVLENIALPLELSNVSKHERLKAARGLLSSLGLSEEFAEAYPGELSGGMAQRVALGRVLIQKPDVLLLDEPFGALDALTREQISLDLMAMWAAQRQTVLMITHSIHEAILLSDRILVLSQRPGQIIADIAVPLPRPRRLEVAYSPEFGEIASHIREIIEKP
ncbi:MAG: ABC transporter ATP-binding protein [Anaerolineae bacterium]|nr:ABC transporter ATP-binding protein [Anaerolineae bacterium]